MAGRVIIVGAGVGGLCAAVWLAAAGNEVIVLERAPSFGGKMREERVGGLTMDVGPTVLTMRPVFEALFAQAGARLEDHVALTPATVLARHAWSDGLRLDLMADAEGSAANIEAAFGSREADAFRRFCAHIRRTYDVIEQPFIHAQRPGLLEAGARWGRMGPRAVGAIDAHRSMASCLRSFFREPRLRQLFGRYATYVGSSPFAAPATLNLIAHVEQQGVWLVDGGMRRLAVALAGLVWARGGVIRCNAEVAELLVESGRVVGVRLADGDALYGDAVVLNAAAEALTAGLFGTASRHAGPAPAPRSLSALTVAAVGRCEGWPAARHTVLFSDDSEAEFAALFEQGAMPADPTVYLCAQDRDCAGGLPATRAGRERLFFIMNAPARGDQDQEVEVQRCLEGMHRRLSATGLTASWAETDCQVTTPRDFHQRFPATGGALYGSASHGAMASFRRPAARSGLPGLYLAGGSAHPGAGVPMVALSGMRAAELVSADLASIPLSKTAVIAGGISTR